MLCQYDRDGFDPVTLASVAAFHTRSVAAATYYADAIVRICRQYAPPGIRLAGEIDHKNAEPLALALAEAIRLDGDITINMAGLGFIDGVVCPDDRGCGARAGRVPHRGAAVPSADRGPVHPAGRGQGSRRHRGERDDP